MRAAFIVLSLATAAFAALMPRQSAAPPGCSYDECPLDLTALAPTGANNDGVSLICNYDGTDLCIYSLTDGTLNVAASLNGGVNCTPLAIETCTRNTPRYRGEDNFTAQRRKLASARAASVPLTRAMEARRALGRTKSVAKDI